MPSDMMWTCNRENGSTSELWGRKCWIADSVASLIHSRVEYLAAKYAPDIHNADTDPTSPLWLLIAEISNYCDELRVKNGLRDPGVLGAEVRAKIDPRLLKIAAESNDV